MTLPSSIGGRITEEVGFFECDAATLAGWILQGLDGRWVKVIPGWSSLADALVTLQPAPILSRYACTPVDGWTALLSNGPLGTDVGALPSQAARELGCRAVRAVRVEDDATYSARILEVYSPAGEPPLALQRSVVAANDGGRWVFETSGTPFPFEDPAAYSRRAKATRFTGEMLMTYLRALGVPAEVDPDWRTSRLVEHLQ
jgi:hypothetical protein